jgi:hypothetical protein
MRCLLAAALCLAMIARSDPALAQLRIALSCGAVAIEFRLCQEGARAWARETGHHVELVSTPSGASERLALYQQLLAARSEAIDVLQVDVVWPGLLGRHLLDLSEHVAADTRAAFHPAIIANNTVGGRLVGDAVVHERRAAVLPARPPRAARAAEAADLAGTLGDGAHRHGSGARRRGGSASGASCSRAAPTRA